MLRRQSQTLRGMWPVIVLAGLVALLSACTASSVPAEPTVAQPAEAPSAAQDQDHDEETITTGKAEALPAVSGRQPRIIATTTIVGDVVRQIAGERITVTVLMPVNADPHAFEPTPRDIAAVAEADVVFINGLGLEEFLRPLIENSGIDPARIIAVSDGVQPLDFAGEAAHADDEEHADEEEHHHSGADPHVWFNPLNVAIWSDTIAGALSALDPPGAASYSNNAERYKTQLNELDATLQQEVARIPVERRKLVTDHDNLAYLAEHYGFELIGAVIPAVSSAAQPSAQELAELQTAIKEYGVPAIFVGSTVNPQLAEQVAKDTGVKLLPIYTDSLSDSSGPAATYLDLMRYTIRVIVSGLA